MEPPEVGVGEPEQQSIRITMSGDRTFYSFAYLMTGAGSLSLSAQEHLEGSGYCQVAAVMFSAFAIEAALNHVGQEKVPDWDKIERSLSPRKKLEKLANLLGFEADFQQSPFVSFIEIFEFRKCLAHGRTKTEPHGYEYRGRPEDDRGQLDPEWLKKFWEEDQVDRVVDDTRKTIEILLEAAGFDKATLHKSGEGSFSGTLG